jgi:hypothetical protein
LRGRLYEEGRDGDDDEIKSRGMSLTIVGEGEGKRVRSESKKTQLVEYCIKKKTFSHRLRKTPNLYPTHTQRHQRPCENDHDRG